MQMSTATDATPYKDHAALVAGLQSLTGDPLEPGGGRIVVFRGSPSAKVMVIGEAPGALEDETGTPFVGRSGQLLDSILTAAGFDVANDIYVTNIVKRRPPENRDPTVKEIMFYRPFLMEEVRLVKPHIIITTGDGTSLTVLAHTATPLADAVSVPQPEVRLSCSSLLDQVDGVCGLC